jgi:ElaB/YqjD/DUF883 family membrane-anchored ribosome-binding protein
MFGAQRSKLDVLESKFDIYEDLSKQMIDKLEAAVDKIGESNNKIATILSKHDEKLEQGVRTDELIVKMIEDVKDSNTKEHTQVISRLESVEKTIDDLLKFRWQAVTIGSVALLVIGAASAIVPPFIDNVMESHYNRETTTPHAR